MVTFGLASEGESEIREVTCQRCGTVNPVRMGMSGTQTIFCKGCGMEIKLVSARAGINDIIQILPEVS